jgi:hypothetical protein
MQTALIRAALVDMTVWGKTQSMRADVRDLSAEAQMPKSLVDCRRVGR